MRYISFSWTFANLGRSPSSPLLKLPQEIIDTIVLTLAYTGIDEDTLCLSLSCSYFFRLLASWAQAHLIRDAAPWAGDRLIYVGAEVSSYPYGIATDEEQHEWEGHGAKAMYRLADAILPEKMRFEGDERAGERPRTLMRRVEHRLTDDDRGIVKRLLQRRMLSITDPSSSPVLRNLTTRQYIRDEVIANSDHAYSLGEVIVTFALWFDADSPTLLSQKGEWAGHRFDIATVADVAEGWTDVSATAVNNLQKIGEPRNNGRRTLLRQ